MIGKPGRPPEDRVARQQEIFLLVAPLIAGRGVREITMARAGQAARMSVGGLYHYFGSKRELLLFGFAPANLERLCAVFRDQHLHLAQTDPPALLTASLDALTAAAGAYISPSALAAVQLGFPTLRAHLDEVLTTEIVGLVETIQLAHPGLDERSALALNRALRRLCVTELLDPEMSSAELLAQLKGTVAAYTQPKGALTR